MADLPSRVTLPPPPPLPHHAPGSDQLALMYQWMEQSRRDSLEHQNKFMEQMFGMMRGQLTKNPEQGVMIGDFQKTRPPTF